MALVVKNLPANAGDIRDECSILGLERSLGERKDYSLQCSCLENPMDRGAWWGDRWATVHRAAKSRTQLKQLSTHTVNKEHLIFFFFSLFKLFIGHRIVLTFRCVRIVLEY